MDSFERGFADKEQTGIDVQLDSENGTHGNTGLDADSTRAAEAFSQILQRSNDFELKRHFYQFIADLEEQTIEALLLDHSTTIPQKHVRNTTH